MKTQPARNRRTAAILGAVTLLATGLLLLPSHPGGEGRDLPSRPSTVTTTQATSDASVVAKDEPTTPTPAAPVSAAALLTAFEAELQALAADKSLPATEREAKARAILARLRATLRDLPADQAAAAIVAFLNTGRDAATGLGFTLAGGGLLEDAPSLRTGLLDLLGQLDPGLALGYAQTIFNQSQNADEWAVALRNIGWQNEDGNHTAELRTRLTQLLDNAAMLAHPTAGFFEAFDIAVHLGGTAEFAGMASVMNLQDTAGQNVNNGSTHAAYLALDRITLQNPDQALTQLAADPALLSWAPQHRGSLIARADVTSPAQLAALETCLTTIASRPQELETFTSMFPNRNGLLGNALVTTPRTEPAHEQLLNGDRAALATVNGWLQTGRFPGIENNLRTISARLSGFIADASAGN